LTPVNSVQILKDWWWTNQNGTWMQNSSTRQKIENLDRANKVEMEGTAPGTPLAGQSLFTLFHYCRSTQVASSRTDATLTLMMSVSTDSIITPTD
jgi:hypothetical protein